MTSRNLITSAKARNPKIRESLTPAVKAGASTHKSALIRSVRRSKNATASRHSLARERPGLPPIISVDPLRAPLQKCNREPPRSGTRENPAPEGAAEGSPARKRWESVGMRSEPRQGRHKKGVDGKSNQLHSAEGPARRRRRSAQTKDPGAAAARIGKAQAQPEPE